eukprot:scaffold42240_cov60-Attheya_sp.AAC.7
MVPTSASNNESVAGFPESAYWKKLHAERNNLYQNPRIDLEQHKHQQCLRMSPVKYQSITTLLSTLIIHHLLEEIKTAKKLKKNGRIKKNKSGGNVEYTQSIMINRGHVCPEFLTKHGLDALSEPVDCWMSPFWPRSADPGKFSVGLCTTDTNHKASLMHAGTGGLIYNWFTNFTVDEIQKYQGIHIVQGLSPSPG